LNAVRGKGAADWLHAVPDVPGKRLQNDEFRMAVRMRLHLEGGTLPVTCLCGVTEGKRPIHHPTACRAKGLKGTQCQRHDWLKFRVAGVLRDVGLVTRVEPWLRRGDNAQERKGIRADISVHMGGKMHIVDVQMVQPTAASYRKMAAKKVGATALLGEKRKETRYAREMKQPERAGQVFVPFIAETYGMLGRQATRFLGSVARTQARYEGVTVAQLKWDLRQRVSVAVVQSEARAMIEALAVLGMTQQ